MNLHRRTVLKGLGVSLALPYLEIMGKTTPKPIKRFIATQTPFGVFPETWFPKQTGKNFDMPEVLSTLAPIKNEVTVFSRIDHNLAGTHTFLSGIKSSNSSAWPQSNISLDQFLADHSEGETRLASLILGSEGRSGTGWTRFGTNLPKMSLQKAYEEMFLEKSADAIKAEKLYLAQNKSVLDVIYDNAKKFKRTLGKSDKAKLEEYFSSVRETERKLQEAGVWIDRKKPTTDVKAPVKESPDLAQDLAILALATDSTRVVSYDILNQKNDLDDLKIVEDYHALSHHGMRPQIVEKLQKVERLVLSRVVRFVNKLKETKDSTGISLYDSTVSIFGSGMGDGSRHTNSDLPIILTGGGVKHAGHIDNQHKQPLNNVFLSIAQWYGVQADSFNTSKSTFTGLEMA